MLSVLESRLAVSDALAIDEICWANSIHNLEAHVAMADSVFDCFLSCLLSYACEMVMQCDISPLCEYKELPRSYTALSATAALLGMPRFSHHCILLSKYHRCNFLLFMCALLTS